MIMMPVDIQVSCLEDDKEDVSTSKVEITGLEILQQQQIKLCNKDNDDDDSGVVVSQKHGENAVETRTPLTEEALKELIESKHGADFYYEEEGEEEVVEISDDDNRSCPKEGYYISTFKKCLSSESLLTLTSIHQEGGNDGHHHNHHFHNSYSSNNHNETFHSFRKKKNSNINNIDVVTNALINIRRGRFSNTNAVVNQCHKHSFNNSFRRSSLDSSLASNYANDSVLVYPKKSQRKNSTNTATMHKSFPIGSAKGYSIASRRASLDSSVSSYANDSIKYNRKTLRRNNSNQLSTGDFLRHQQQQQQQQQRFQCLRRASVDFSLCSSSVGSYANDSVQVRKDYFARKGGQTTTETAKKQQLLFDNQNDDNAYDDDSSCASSYANDSIKLVKKTLLSPTSIGTNGNTKQIALRGSNDTKTRDMSNTNQNNDVTPTMATPITNNTGKTPKSNSTSFDSDDHNIISEHQYRQQQTITVVDNCTQKETQSISSQEQKLLNQDQTDQQSEYDSIRNIAQQHEWESDSFKLQLQSNPAA